MRGSWRLNKDCNILTSPAPPDIAVCRSRSPDAQPEARGSAFCWLSLQHLVFNSSGPKLTNFLSSPSYIIVQSPTQPLEWPVCSLSSGNNCHAVHRSLSSGASVYECIMGFFALSHFVSQIRLRDFFRLLAIGMRHFLPVHHFGMAYLAGSKVNIQHMHIHVHQCESALLYQHAHALLQLYSSVLLPL